MNRLVLLMITAILSTSAISNASFVVNVTSGEILIVNKQGSQKKVSPDSAILDSGDSIILASENQASISIEKNSRILCKGPLTAYLTSNNSAFQLALEDGQIFLDRNQPNDLSSVTITSRGYNFTPMGTAAAVRVSKSSQPATAVIKGKMKMQAPTGESIVVDEGNHGSVDQNGNLTSGKLPQSAIESLESWAKAGHESIAQKDTETVSTPPAVSVMAPLTPAAPVSVPDTVSSKSEKSPEPADSSKVNANQPVNQTQPVAQGAAASVQANESGTENDKNAENEKKAESGKNADAIPGQAGTTWEISAGTATVDNKQWTRVAIGADVPIWKFGVFFDVEMFIDDKGKVSDKGWNFKDEPYDAITRKIRYIRFGHEQDPLFVKFGGLSNVTLGYGFIVDRFTNMLHYPDQKLLGLQFNLNDISPIGITLQTLIADFKDFNNDGGVVAARLAFAPFKMSEIPIVKGITFGGTYAVDINQYAPARDWDFRLDGAAFDRDKDVVLDGPYIDKIWQDASDTLTDEKRQKLIKNGEYDTLIENKDKWASREDDQFGLIGGDVGIPLIRSSLVNLDLYGQAGIREDLEHGWGIGAPGLSLKVWKLWAGIEYRHVEGRFAPGYFGTYYLDERLQRDPFVATKEQLLVDDELNGVFGRLGFNVANVLIVDGAYQYMIGSDDSNKDQRFEITGSIGDLIVKKIPRLTKAEIYYQKTRIGRELVSVNEFDSFFEKTPYMYWGYRIGIGIAQGASLVFDSRYGFKRGGDGYKMLPDNNISIQTAISF